MRSENLELKIKMLPDSPGCYLMKENGKIIYVGKAVNLKNRVRSYFHGEHTPKVAAMISHIEDFDIMLCRTNLEALMLECNLIKLHKPYYNIKLKDDKAYPFIRVGTEPFPRVTLARRETKDGARYFGPYVGATAVRDVLDVLRKLFPLRTCALELPLKNGAKHRPCMNYEIGRCLAPCAGKCSEAEYDMLLMRVTAFLNGKYPEVVGQLEDEMRDAAKKFEYERAARLRDNIRDINGLMERQQAVKTGSDTSRDILALAQDGIDAVAQVLFVRGGHMVGGENFALPGDGGEPAEEVLNDFVLQYYETHQPAREVLCQSAPEAEDTEQWLRDKRGGAVSFSVPQRGEKRALVLMAEKNARDALEKRNAKRVIHEERTVGACRQLADAIGMAPFPHRIEGFDISNTQGVLSVASMVVFIDGEPAKKEYRHYRIKTVVGANDFASMNEVLYRRFKRALSDDPKEKWPMPDLVLIDGGPEQLAFAQRAMHDAGADVPMFGLAKRLEEIYLPDNPVPVVLDHHTPALQLIQRIRDEAHRFAITHHRNLRGKAAVHSRLEDIPGVGPARRRALLACFRTITAIENADVDQLMHAEGMTRPAAEAVYNTFHPEIK